MARTAVSTFITELKRRFDYDIDGDTDLDNLIIDFINDGIKEIKQLFYDQGLMWEISQTAHFQTEAGESSRDLSAALIVGDQSTFTGQAGDTIDVHIDGTDYADIDISACTTIALVVAAINAAVASTVAYEDDNGYLMIKSLTTGSTSIVTIADGTSTAQTVIAELFSDSVDRTSSGIVDIDDIIKISERTNDTVPIKIPYDEFIEFYPDPTANTSTTADHVALWDNLLFFGPTPSAATRYYIEYIKLITDVAAGGTLPFENKYDPVLKAMAILYLMEWKDNTNIGAITSAKNTVDRMVERFIVGAAKNFGQVRQVQRRSDPYDEPYIDPQPVR